MLLLIWFMHLSAAAYRDIILIWLIWWWAGRLEDQIKQPGKLSLAMVCQMAISVICQFSHSPNKSKFQCRRKVGNLFHWYSLQWATGFPRDGCFFLNHKSLTDRFPFFLLLLSWGLGCCEKRESEGKKTTKVASRIYVCQRPVVNCSEMLHIGDFNSKDRFLQRRWWHMNSERGA